MTTSPLTLVLGGTGKTGRRIVQRLTDRGLPVRVGSRSAAIPFEWEDPTTWGPALEGVDRVYISYFPDLAVPGAPEAVRALADLAVEKGATRLVLLSGRGEEEAQRAEASVQEVDAEVTIVRCAWFMQAFTEDYLLGSVLEGEVVLPAGADQLEPFVHADDIADVATAALTEDGHAGQVYELTSPRLMTFPEAVAEVSKAAERELRYVEVSVEDYAAAAAESGVPAEYVGFLTYLFTEVFGKNAHVTDGVFRATGQAPRDFTAFARDAAAAGAWDLPAA